MPPLPSTQTCRQRETEGGKKREARTRKTEMQRETERGARSEGQGELDRRADEEDGDAYL